MKRHSGQILAGVIIMLLVLAIIIPSMVMYVGREAAWSVKQGENSNAFQLAEAAVDRGYQKVTESTTTFRAILNGTEQANFHLDRAYTDLAGGEYAVGISSGPDEDQVTIIGIGRDKNLKEVRALKVVYVNSVMGNVGLQAADGVVMSGANVQVEWGAVVSPKTIDVGDKEYPSYFSAASIIINGTTYGPTGQLNDSSNWWWHAYYSAIPPSPSLSFNSYKTSATDSGNDPCGNPYYKDGSWDKHTFTSCINTQGRTYYVTGNWDDFDTAVTGNVIVLGNLNYSNGQQPGVAGSGPHDSYAAKVPAVAWKQYCNKWDVYQGYDAYAVGKPACFGGLTSSYKASGVTHDINPGIRGLLYVGGDLDIPNGGGNSDLVHGIVVVQGDANIDANSHCKVWYDPSVAMNLMTTTIILTRESWQDLVREWPSNL